jgi:hypothetical protein
MDAYAPDGSARFVTTHAWDGADWQEGPAVWQQSGGVSQLLNNFASAMPNYEPFKLKVAADGSMLTTGYNVDPEVADVGCLGAKLDSSGQVEQVLPLLPGVQPSYEHCFSTALTTDGSRLIDFDESYGYPRTITTALDGSDRRFVTPPGIATLSCCKPSPDGQRLLFAGRRVPIDAQGHIDGADVPYGDSWFTWSDIFNPLSQGASLFTVDIDTGELRTQAVEPGHPLYNGGIDFSYPQASSALRLSADTPSSSAYRSADVLTLVATAEGIRSTVSNMALFLGNQRYEPTGTPSDASFRIPLNGIAEGRHLVHVAAATTTGLERDVQRTVVVDNTAPQITDEVSATKDPTDDSAAVVSWQAAADPALADGTPGSGVAKTQYRYRRSTGGWSSWATTTDDSFSAPVADLGDLVDLRSEDAAGNRRLIRAHMSQVEVTYPSGTCGLALGVSGQRKLPGYAPQFRIEQTSARFSGSLNCNSDVTKMAISDVCLFVQLRGDAWTSTGSCFSTSKAITGHTADLGLFKWMCQRPADGVTAFRLSGRYQVWTNILNGAKTLTTRPVKFSCPTESERVEAEAEGWRSLKGSNPSRALGNALGHPYPFDRKGWDAHHVIPANEKSSDASFIESIGFRCHVYVNVQNNGLWLRNRSGPLANGKPGYDALASITSHPGLQKRVQHWYYGYRYSAAITAPLLLALDRDGNCRGASETAKQRSAYAAIHAINASDLANGHIPGIGDSPPN